jgi:hypothetical protein
MCGPAIVSSVTAVGGTLGDGTILLNSTRAGSQLRFRVHLGDATRISAVLLDFLSCTVLATNDAGPSLVDVLCAVPAGIGARRKLTVRGCLAHDCVDSYAAAQTVSYPAPLLIKGTLCANGQCSSRVSLDTNRQAEIRLTGRNFGPDWRLLSVTYKAPISAVRFPCVVSPDSTDSTIVCFTRKDPAART